MTESGTKKQNVERRAEVWTEDEVFDFGSGSFLLRTLAIVLESGVGSDSMAIFKNQGLLM